MSNDASRPVGWYPRPERPGQYEYWDGAAWTGALAPIAPPVVKTGLGLWTWLGIILSALCLLAFAAQGASGLLIGAGLIAFITAVYVIAVGRPSWMKIPTRKVAAIVLAGAFAAILVGSLIGAPRQAGNVSALVDASDERPATSAPSETSAAPVPVASASPTPVSSPSPTPVVKKPKVTTKQVTEVQDVPFTETVVDDGTLAAGTTAVTTTGVAGKRTITYKVTYSDGVETGRTVLTDKVTLQPVNQVVANGTYVAPAAPVPFVAAGGGCDPNYGGCVPIDSDVDCGGGSGDGPSYLYGTVEVIGSDIYGLDRDHDGVACD